MPDTLQPIPQKMWDLFANTSAIRLVPEISAQRIEEDRTVVIGAVAGPKLCATHALHEMAHLVEIDTRRMGMFGWGLRIINKQVIMGQVYYEPLTHQITDRELRVIALQASVAPHLGLDFDIEDWAESLVYLSDTAFVPIEDGSAPYGENSTHGLEYAEIGASQQRWRVAQVHEYMKTYTAEFFFTEWERRLKLLEQRKKRHLRKSK